MNEIANGTLSVLFTLHILFHTFHLCQNMQKYFNVLAILSTQRLTFFIRFGGTILFCLCRRFDCTESGYMHRMHNFVRKNICDFRLFFRKTYSK